MMNNTTNRIIDAHVHVWTYDTERYPFAPGFQKKDLWRPSFTPEQHFEYSRSVGAVRLNLVQMSSWYGTDHSYILDLIAGDPDTFVGTGSIVLSDPEPGRTMAALARRRCFAFREPASELDHPALEKMFAAGAEYNLALSFNMGVALLPDLDRMCTRFPETPVIIDHVCHVGIAEADYTEEQIGALLRFARHKRIIIKMGPFQALGARTPPYLDILPLIERVVGAYGPERCMWESDSGGPIWMSDPHSEYPAAIALIRDHASFLSDSDKDYILFKTAEDFFFNR